MHNGHLHGKAFSIFADFITDLTKENQHLWLVGCIGFKVSFCSTATCCIESALKLAKLVKMISQLHLPTVGDATHLARFALRLPTVPQHTRPCLHLHASVWTQNNNNQEIFIKRMISSTSAFACAQKKITCKVCGLYSVTFLILTNKRFDWCG